MKKGLIAMIIAGIVSVGLITLTDKAQSPVSEATYTAGTYEGSAKGHNDNVHVLVTTSEHKIEQIEVSQHDETEGIGSIAVEKLPANIIKAQSLGIDNIAGATQTSQAIKSAALKALKKAGADEETLLIPKVSVDTEAGTTSASVAQDIERDIVVVGAGGAGLTAAITIQEAGKNVILLEKMPMVGGNTSYATAGMNASGTDVQKAQNVDDSADRFYADTMKGGKNRNNPELLRVLAEKSKDMVPWLKERGLDLPEITMTGGTTAKRTHRPTGGVAIGPALVKALKDRADAIGVEIRTESEVTKILVNEGEVIGVEVKDIKSGNTYVVRSKAVVMATGGFGSNPDMIKEYNPALEGFGSTNSPAITGDGIKMIREIGGALVDMELIQTHPTVVHKNTVMITEAVRGEGAILVNREGKRFISEMETRDAVSAAELAQTGKSAFLVFDQSVRSKLKAIEKYVKDGYAIEGATVEELAQKVGIDPAGLADTLTKVAGYVEAGADTEFANKALATPLNTAPYYAIEVSPAIHHTMGGVKINTNAQVIDVNGNPIKGLYAAGEITGGIHGGNRIGGNAIADIEVFGKIAGDNAILYIEAK